MRILFRCITQACHYQQSREREIDIAAKLSHPHIVPLFDSGEADGLPDFVVSAMRSAAEERGYDEINLNVGCPSDRVQSGRFGACLMAEPELVRDCMAAMIDAVSVPVTVKHRIGIDDKDSP